jgi:hypothetical protein
MRKPSRLTTGVAFASSLFVAAAALSTVNPTQPADAAVHPRSAAVAHAPFATNAVSELVEVRLPAQHFTRHPH